MNLTLTLGDVLHPLYLLLLSCFISPIFGGVTSLYVSSTISVAAGALMIYLSINSIVLGGLSSGLRLLAGSSQILPGFFSVGVDGLSAFFIMTLGILILASSTYGISYLKRYAHTESLRLYSFLYPLFLLSMYLVIISSDVILFIISWELMSITAFFLISYEKVSEVARRAALKYILMSYSGSSLLIIALMLASFIGGSTNFTALKGLVLEPTVHYLIMILLVAGFGIKAALVPMHSWLPDAHPEAPSNISALLSGFMIKTAVYGVIRFAVILLSLNYYVLGLVLASLGAASTIYGTLMALTQTDSKRLMAYSSVAQIGYIFLGIGGGLTLYPNYLGFIAFSAGLLHTLNHAISKGLLFLTAGSLIYGTNSRNLNLLGGLAKAMPITYVTGLVGSLAISGMPPLNGFISKWLILIPLLISGNSVLALYAAVAVFASALTTAAFTKYLARAYLSSPKDVPLSSVREAPPPMTLAMILLASLCVALGVFYYIPLNMTFSVVSSIAAYDVSYVGVIASDIIPALYVFSVLISGILVSVLVTAYLMRRHKLRLTPLWTFGTKDLLPRKLGLNAHSYYTEFENTYNFVYVLRDHIHRSVINPLRRWFVTLASSYDAVDTYLPTALVTITILLLLLTVLTAYGG
ncbi:MAG: proton-conducting transporter membrane subunit [Sulfolobales archaeon]